MRLIKCALSKWVFCIEFFPNIFYSKFSPWFHHVINNMPLTIENINSMSERITVNKSIKHTIANSCMIIDAIFIALVLVWNCWIASGNKYRHGSRMLQHFQLVSSICFQGLLFKSIVIAGVDSQRSIFNSKVFSFSLSWNIVYSAFQTRSVYHNKGICIKGNYCGKCSH